MNILFLSTENPYPPDHGHHIRTFNILKGLANSNNIFFVGFAKDKHELQYNKYLEKYCSSVNIYLIPPGLLKWRFYLSALLNLFTRQPFQAQRYVTKKAKFKIKQILHDNKIDLVHCDMLHLSLYFSTIHTVPKVVVNHNVESLRLLRWYLVEKNIAAKLFLFIQHKKLYEFEKKMCPEFDRCIVVSDYDKGVLLKMCQKDNFVIIPNGVDCEYFKPNYGNAESNSLVWAGAMDGPYNKDAVDYFLDKIHPLVQSEVPGLIVSFIGKSPTEKLVKMAEINQNVKALGYVEDIRPIIEKALIFIAPIRSGSGTKIKILNAMAQGKAVITTTIGAEGIDVTNGRNIIIADDAKSFAEKTLFLLNHPDKAQTIGENGRKLVEKKYDWKIINKMTNHVYKQLVI